MRTEIPKFPKAHFRKFRKICRIFLTQILRIFCRNGRFMSPHRILWKNYRNFLRKFPVKTGPFRSYLGVTCHWIDPSSFKRNKVLLSYNRVKGSHTHDVIKLEPWMQSVGSLEYKAKLPTQRLIMDQTL